MGKCCYLAARKINEILELDIESVIICFVARYVEIPCDALTFADDELLSKDPLRNDCFKTLETGYFKLVTVNKNHSLETNFKFSILPLARDKMLGISYSGLCTVIRFIVKSKEEFTHLLGATRNCFKACAEVSKWTDMCENKFLKSTKEFMSSPQKISSRSQIINIFSELELHLSMPPTVSNVNKRGREAGKENLDLLRVHPFIEGLDFLLTDLVICCYINIILNVDYTFYSLFGTNFPRLFAWFYRIIERDNVKSTIADIFDSFPIIHPPSPDIIYVDNHPPTESLSKIIVPKVSPECIEEVLLKVSAGNFVPMYNATLKLLPSLLPQPDVVDFCFSEIRGILPQKRFNRKREQLENMINSVYSLASRYPRPCHIVDFCCGSGYLGIILSRLLPQCRITLVENKEESLARALPILRRKLFKASNELGVLQPNLVERSQESANDSRDIKGEAYHDSANVEIYQCNLEHFLESFDIGICLHGCGLVTDLVLRKCYRNNASFVVCPCCYGAIKGTDSMSYPRSASLNSFLTYKDYSTLAHAADQTEQGIKQCSLAKKCMTLIDTDRLKEADSNGYSTRLVTMSPPSCTPKNNLLIGMLAEDSVNFGLEDVLFGGL